MDDDWDLHAVVRGCAAVNTASAATATATAAAAASNNDDPFPSFSYMSFHDDQTSFDFPDLVVDDRNEDPFQGLREIYQEFCVDDAPPPPPATTASAVDIAAADTTCWAISANPSSNFFQSHREIAQIKPAPHSQENTQFINNNNNNNHRLGSSSSSHNFPAAINPHPIRPRRRKNQQMKMVRQMTQEELSADSWAWRKYGQKPIKGSPYPRNYYRCSTSKGCAARKQVERSPNDPGIFVVSYTGEHTHPRPTHRSSLAGSTRSKLSSSTAATAAAAKNSNNNNNAAVSHHQKSGSISLSSSPPPAAAASGSSFSPNTPLMEGGAAAAENDVEMAAEEEEENNINLMISNDMIMNDDDDDIMFKGFQDSDHDSGGGGGGGNLFSSGLLSSPPWTPTSSAVV